MTAPPLIGRRRETAWLADAADAALAGRGSLVLLAGEAGVGKTHLAEAAFAGRAAAARRGAGARGRPVRAGRGRAALAPARRPGGARRRAARCARTWRCCCRSSAPARATPASDRGDDVRGRARRARDASRPRVSCWTTCSGRTERRSSCSRRSPRRCASCRCSSSAPTGPTRSAAGIRCGGCAPTCAAAGCCASSSSTRWTRPRPASWPRVTLGARARRRRSPTRCTTARRASRSSSRSSRRACRRAIGCARAAAGSSSTHDADVPVPETIRDAVLLRTAGLSDAGRAAAEAAAVAGSEFRLDLAPGLDELLAGRADRRDRAAAAPRSATRSCAARSTRTSRGAPPRAARARSPSG